MLSFSIFSPFFLAAFAAAFSCAILVLTRPLHGHLTLDNEAGVQKVHKAPTPRVGGLAIMVGWVVGGIALPPAMQSLWWLLCLAVLPAFLSGLIEDLTKRVSVRVRLAATIGSGLLFCLLTGYAITSVGIPGPDWLLATPLFAIAFSAFAIGGIANSINIIDGFHGLAAGCSIIVTTCFGIVAYQSGDMVMVTMAALVAGGILGFFVLNFPWGWIFLGDAGAYSVGFFLAVMAVMLPARNPEVSPLIGLVALAYPVTETMVSILRRSRRAGANPGDPDRLHLHSLIYRSMARDLATTLGQPGLRNPCTSVIVWTLPLLSAGFAFLGQNQPLLALPLIGAVVVVYLWLYRRVALIAPRAPQLKQQRR